MYFPKSQIKTNLYTNGGEYSYSSNGEEYIGYYWKTASGKFFTGKTPSDSPIELLIPLADSFKEPSNIKGSFLYIYDGIDFADPQSPSIEGNLEAFEEEYKENDIKTYSTLKNIDTNKAFLLPTYSPNIPTNNDYIRGEYRRLFCKKTNEILYTEISSDFYKKLVNKDSTVAYEYYTPFNIPWKLTGNKEQVYKVNKNVVELTMKQQKLPSFNKYLKEDYTKYYK